MTAVDATLNYCGVCGKSEIETLLRDETDDWLGCWVCHDSKDCVSSLKWRPRQRHYAELTPEVLDRLEAEGDKDDHQCEMYGAREISGPELLALIRIARNHLRIVRLVELDEET